MELLNLEVVWDYGPVFLRGLMITIMLTGIVIVVAGTVAIPIARRPPVRSVGSYAGRRTSTSSSSAPRR